jgi:hypothetical protein
MAPQIALRFCAIGVTLKNVDVGELIHLFWGIALFALRESAREIN